MFYYLTKILEFFAVPSNLILIIMISGLLLWRSRYADLGRRMAVTGIALILIAGMTPLGTALLLPLENRFPPWIATEAPPDGIVVVGGIINTNVTLLRRRLSFGLAVDRLLAVIDLHRQYPAARIVFSGGNSNLIFKGKPEADLAVEFLERYGVPGADILVDRAARDTVENAANAKKIAAPKPGERWLLVTSAFHMPRAVGIFRVAGFPVEAYPVQYLTGGWGDVVDLEPSLLGGIEPLDVAAHEWEGLFVDWFTGRTSALFPGPTS